MRIVDPKHRPKPFYGSGTHARLRHDYATWHPAHVNAALKSSKRKLPFENRSKFDTFYIIEEAVSRSVEHPAVVEEGKNSNYVISFDMGYEVGFDAIRKRRTSTVTVVLKPTGEVATVHPGRPREKVTSHR